MINEYLIEPHWANWMLVLEMFAAGVAAGTFLFIALANLAGGKGRAGTEDREVAARLGFVPLPLMLVVAILLVVDLGQPFRFLNLVVRSPIAEERGPSPIMFNLNSPMNWGTAVIVVFGLFTLVAFLDALFHTGRWRLALSEALSHNPVWLAIGAFFALATGAYSGVLINVTSQNVWGDTFLLGALFAAFSALSGMAVAAIATDRMRAPRTAGAVRSGLIGFAAICGLLLALLVINLLAVGRASPLIGTMRELVAPVFWIGVVGAAILAPIVLLLLRRRPATRLAVVGVVVLAGVLAFRYSMLYSALAAVEG
ncbi:MAG: NrfD/PsrC family molybdoenzyme membrane anchor subunit [Candidatus Limnocylindria bacterium]